MTEPEEQIKNQENMDIIIEDTSREDIQMTESQTTKIHYSENTHIWLEEHEIDKEMEINEVQNENENKGTEENQDISQEEEKIIQDNANKTTPNANEETVGNSSDKTDNSTPKTKVSYKKALRSPILSSFQPLKVVQTIRIRKGIDYCIIFFHTPYPVIHFLFIVFLIVFVKCSMLQKFRPCS